MLKILTHKVDSKITRKQIGNNFKSNVVKSNLSNLFASGLKFGGFFSEMTFVYHRFLTFLLCFFDLIGQIFNEKTYNYKAFTPLKQLNLKTLKYKSNFYCVLIFLGIQIYSSNVLVAQIEDDKPWCPEGATWIYRTFSPTSVLFHKFEYVKDSSVLSKQVKVWSVHLIEYNGWDDVWSKRIELLGYEYLYESNDSIYWYDKVKNSFAFIYSFSPKEGDYFIVGNSRANCIESFPEADTLFVSSIDTIAYDNRVFKYFNTSLDRKFILGTVISKIGSLLCPFPEINRLYCESSEAEYGDFYERLVCYSDKLRGNIVFSPQDVFKDICDVETAVDNYKSFSSEILIFPNPAQNVLNIISKDKTLLNVQIFNLNGKLLMKENIFSLKKTFDISSLEIGMYFILIEDNLGRQYFFKFLKN